MDKLIQILIYKNLTISTAESCTGGLLAYYLTREAGASEYYKGSVIAYNNSVKKNILKVSEETINNGNVISKECAIEMVLGLKSLINTDICVSITGNAGPTCNREELRGITYYSIYYNNKIETGAIKCTNMKRTSVQRIIVKTIIKKLLTSIINS